MFKDKDGKLSLTRVASGVAFLFAMILAVVSVVVSAYSNNPTVVSNSTPIITAFLIYAGGQKVGDKFATKGSK
jgi:hypothetical protein